MLDIISIVSNLGALAVIGLIYAAYIKNLRAVNDLKDSQLKVAEQNTKLWKDRVLELERNSPAFIEKQLSDRIKIREDELSRLVSDNQSNADIIKAKNNELISLKSSLEAAQKFQNLTSVYDSDIRDYIEIPVSMLDRKIVGEVYVDSASLLICDPWHLKVDDEVEQDNWPILKLMFEVINTGDRFCTNSMDDKCPSDIFLSDNDSTVEELLKQGLIKEVPYSGQVPAIESTYIKGDFKATEHIFQPVKHYSFLNGLPGAGVSVSLTGDGVYYVTLESYKGCVQRIVIDI